MLVWWLVVLAFSVALVVALLRARRKPNARRTFRRMTALLFALIVLSAPVGLIAALVAHHRQIGGHALEVSQKARMLAEVISEVMNSFAFAVLAFAVPAILALVLFLRSRSALRDQVSSR